MKKLLITTMAAVSVGLCAKADLTAETFETYGEGSLFGTLPGDSSKYEISDGWDTETTLENLFTVTNIANYVGAGTYPEKAACPSKSDSVKALAIDTSAPLLRYADSTKDPQSLKDPQSQSNTPLFFDSVVQFTATDVAPSMENNTTDKLMVWLYATPEGTDGRLFGEDDAITNLVITAGYYDGDGNRSYTNYLTNVAIQPDTWHRLTIKAINDIGIHNLPTPGFEVYVDGNKNPVSGKCDYDGENPTLVTKFPSLIARNNSGFNYLQGVAFDGKGAVDDIVFTTTPPDFAKEEEADDPKVFNVSVTIPENATLFGVMYADMENNYKEVENKYPIEVGTESIVVVVEYDGTVTNEGATELEDGMWAIPVNVSSAGEGQDVQVVITGEPAAGDGNELTKPTVGGVAGSDLSDNAMSKILEVFPEGKYPAAGLTVKVNGETLTGAPAVAMLNDAVEMFTLAKDAKFFDAQGVLDISFKATGADPEAVAYEAKVGGLEATVNETSYEVVPKYIDIATNTELTAKPEGTVTFRLVIQKKTPTPAQ